MPKYPTLICASILAAANVFAQNAAAPTSPAAPKPGASPAPALIPFALPWDDATPSVTNVSTWLEAPAGKQGFITAKEGHLFAGNKRIRLLGMNFAGASNFPTHPDADKIAARLAKFGIGCVRLQQLDTEPSPKGLLKDDKTTMDPAQLEKLDYLVAALKKNGIYVDICLHSGRNYPGMPEWDFMPDHFRGLDNFQPRMIEQQRNYARNLLTHVNPYTHVAYANEPAVAFIEINNGSSLLNEWWNGNLDTMPAVYSDDLRKQWSAWLLAKYGTQAKLRTVWNAHETPEGKEMLGDERGAWYEKGDYPTGVKLQRVEEKRLYGSSAVEQANAIAEAKAKKAEASPPKPASPTPTAQASPATTPAKPTGMADVRAVWLHVTPGRTAWQGYFVREKLAVDPQVAYTFAFEAKCDRPRLATVTSRYLWDPSPEEADVVKVRLPLTDQWQKYSVTFTPKRGIVDSRFGFTELASEVSDWYFADLSLKPAAIQGLHSDEKIGTVGIFRKRDFAARTAEAQRDWVAFLLDTETKYWTGMARFLKDELHTRSLVIGTPVNQSPFPVQAQLDVVGVDGSWQPPSFLHKPGDPADWIIRNVSMVSAIDGGKIGQMGAQRVAGKPYLCTEYNAAAPNTYSSESFLLLSAYAALQDWDAIFANQYATNLDDMKSGMFGSFFDIAQHPTKMATLPASGAMFVRGDVRASTPQVVSVQLDQVIDQIRKTGPALNASQFGARQENTLRHPVQMMLGGTSTPGATPVQSVLAGVTSDTLDLRWNRRPEKGVVTIDTPKSAGVIGYATDTTFPFMQVSITPHASMQNWATVNLTVIEGDDFRKARRILVTATGYVGNTNMVLKKDGQASSVGKEWGKAPSVVEGISATITLPLLAGAKAWALDERGQHKTEVPMKIKDGQSVVEIGPEWKTLWYEIETAVQK